MDPTPRDSPMITRADVLAEARSWLKTPYHPHGRIKGVGVDCGMFLAEVYERVGLIQHCDPGDYSQQWHLHHSAELFLEKIERAGGVRIDGTPQPGDIAMFQFGRAASHGSIVLEWPMVIHSYIGIGVTIDHAENGPLKGRFIGSYTLFPGSM